MLFRCRSEYGEDTIEATDAIGAAEAHAAEAVGERRATVLLTVYVAPAEGDDWERHKAQIDPEEPDCEEAEHQWQDGPVFGSGGGVAYTDVCTHCGLRRHVDGWATDPSDGSQGHRIVRYSPL